ncbi:serine/threonine-protein kinase [Streptomyces sp. V4-01]|uniref:Serine/threonine-protein kinase n=1 Tax=Actinacidiphila polyblastidii TaxID=3110430 RepID=A0ABU7P8V2_9ACTN|nr:serine/threonine-protein kinase [Streptomyces sp. V4-01]
METVPAAVHGRRVASWPVRLPGGADIASQYASHDASGPLQPLEVQDPREQAGYRLLARIGEGGMGTVYLSHTRGGQPVALKVIRREFARDEEFRRRFQQEVVAARRVQGYHVVPVVDHDTTGDQPWLATTYVPGLPLDETLARHGVLPLPAVLQLVGCAAEALRSVHAAGVIHRDLKPSNVLLSAHGPWVIDFGIARAAESTQITRSGGLIGTPQFMSPEHANGLDLTPATDVFSLGLIAAVAATGRHPYGEAGAITLAAKIANTAIRPPDLSGYPDALRPLLERCLVADPAARPAPAELAQLCESAAGRPLRDFAGWLPEPVAAEIVRREAAAQRPPDAMAPVTVPDPPAGAPPGVPQRPAAPPSAYGGSAYTGAHGYGGGTGPAGPAAAAGAGFGMPGGAGAGTGGYGSGFPAQDGPGGPGAPGGPGGGRTRKVLTVGGMVIALVLAVTLTYAFARQRGGDQAADGGSPGTHTGAPGTGTTSASAAASGVGSQGPTGEPTTQPAVQQPQLLVDSRRFVIRSPAYSTGTHVDLDQATVDPNGTIGDTEHFEIEYQTWADGGMRFLTTFGKSAGPTYQQCRDGVGADALPSDISKKDLDADTYFTKGSVLCTVTSDGNLAMLQITDETPSDDSGTTDTMPGYTTLLTVWKMPDGQSRSPGSG